MTPPTRTSTYMNASTVLEAFGSPLTPRGFSKGCPKTVPGEKATKTIPARTALTVNWATHLQRTPGNLPSGNSKNRNTISPRPGTHIQVKIQAATSPAGSDPGKATNVYMAYSPLKWITPKNNPIVQKSHPMVLSGMRPATTAPTVE
jgi:hypothetical protein